MQQAGAGDDPESRLRAAIAAFSGQRFAVLDGGHFDDLPDHFRRARLFARSLFLDGGGPQAQAAGPWLADLGQFPGAADVVHGMVGDRPALVAWCCPQGDAVLFRHLRSLNIARIPSWAADRGPRPIDGAEDADEPVIFRHWDPRVLGALLPVLDAAQFARILGPASEIAFVARDFGGFRRVVAAVDWPAARAGPLRIRSDQIAALSDRRERARYARMRAFLRETAPEETAGLDDHALHRHIVEAERSGSELGLTHERSFSIWSYLTLSTGGSVARIDSVRRFVRSPNGDPDENVQTLLTNMLRLARTEEAR